VCLDGEPGVGKTALAVRWAHSRRARFRDGVLYADLNGYGPGSPVEPATVLATFLRALGMPDEYLPATLPQAGALLQQTLAGCNLLVVLDNVHDSTHVRPLLSPTSPCPVLITSRQKLSTYHTGAHTITIPTLLLDDATALLQQRIGADRAARDLAATHDLMALCAGSPLALGIVGEHVATRPDTPLRDLVEHLRGRRLLDAGSHGDGDPVTIRAVFDLSCNDLPPEIDRLYQLIGIHPSTSVSTAPAAAMAGLSIHDTEQALDALVGAHLIHQQGVDSYRMHDLLHLHAGDRARHRQAPADQRTAVFRMVEWYLLTVMNAVQRLAPQRKPVPPLPQSSDITPARFESHEAAMNWCLRERPQIMAVTRTAAEGGLHHHVWRLVGTFAHLLNKYGDPSEAVDVHQLALNSARIVGSREGEAGNLNNLGVLDFRLGRFDTAARHFAEALAVFQELDDEAGEAASLFNIGNIHLERGALRKASELHKRSLAIATRTGDSMGQARAYHRLGEVHHRLERPELAASYLAEALKLRTQIHDERGLAATLQLLGELSQEAGDVVRAIEYSEHALAIDRRTYDQPQATAALRTLASAHYGRGAHDEAAACAEEAAALCHMMSDTRGEARALDLLARALQAAGQHEPAAETWRRSLALFHRLGDPYAARIASALGAPVATQDPMPEPRTVPLRNWDPTAPRP
jgi:tetratricopeptide (TPR) repeat protein